MPRTDENKALYVGPTSKPTNLSFLIVLHGLCPPSKSDLDEAIRLYLETKMLGVAESLLETLLLASIVITGFGKPD